MLFNTLDFLIFFFPVVLAVFYLVPTAWRLYVLFIASAVFYGYSGAVPLAFMLLSILWAYGFAFVYRAFPGRAVVFLSILFPFLILFLFKYLNFTLDNFGADAETRRSFSFFLDILLPAGISFYTFQIMAYSIDVARGRVPVERNLLSLATFISFFPQLIAGPILRYEQLRDQLHALVSRRDVDHDFVTAAKFIAVGLFGKVFVADVFVLLAGRYDPATNGSAVDTAFVVLADSMIIYFDFWAYSIIAIGLGRCFGIRLPRNFREPYVAASPRDFWRRWHVTLSYWLRDYVYLPLGGNRRYTLNIVIVFAACGAWHGAGWNFVAWGLYHAALVIGYHVVRPAWDRLPSPVQIGLTFVLVSLSWPLFFHDFSSWTEILGRLVTGEFAAQEYSVSHWLYLAAVVSWVFFAREDWWLYNAKPRFGIDWAGVHAVVLFLAVLGFSWSSTFVYFRF